MLQVFGFAERQHVEVNGLTAHPMMRRDEAAKQPNSPRAGESGWHLLANSKNARP